MKKNPTLIGWENNKVETFILQIYAFSRLLMYLENFVKSIHPLKKMYYDAVQTS